MVAWLHVVDKQLGAQDFLVTFEGQNHLAMFTASSQGLNIQIHKPRIIKATIREGGSSLLYRKFAGAVQGVNCSSDIE